MAYYYCSVLPSSCSDGNSSADVRSSSAAPPPRFHKDFEPFTSSGRCAASSKSHGCLHARRLSSRTVAQYPARSIVHLTDSLLKWLALLEVCKRPITPSYWADLQSVSRCHAVHACTCVLAPSCLTTPNFQQPTSFV